MHKRKKKSRPTKIYWKNTKYIPARVSVCDWVCLEAIIVRNTFKKTNMEDKTMQDYSLQGGGKWDRRITSDVKQLKSC